MTQKEQGDFEKIPALRLYRGDRQRLSEYYPKAGYNRVIRRLVHQHLAKMDAKFEQRVAARGLTERGVMEDEEQI